MSCLATQQQEFQRSILTGDAPAELFSGTSRLPIYQRAYRLRLTDALRDNYPVLHCLLGDAAFEALAVAYIDHQPSRNPSIRWFGDQLRGFIEANPVLAPHGSLRDLVNMEWALRSAFDAADAAPIGVEIMAHLPAEAWPFASFTPHPSVDVLALDWDVEPLWKALSSDPKADTQQPNYRPHSTLIWRRDLVTHWRVLDMSEAQLLRSIIARRSFGDLCSQATGFIDDEQAAALAAGLLRAWLEDGLLIDVK